MKTFTIYLTGFLAALGFFTLYISPVTGLIYMLVELFKNDTGFLSSLGQGILVGVVQAILGFVAGVGFTSVSATLLANK